MNLWSRGLVSLKAAISEETRCLSNMWDLKLNFFFSFPMTNYLFFAVSDIKTIQGLVIIIA
jgi:hypothetical protein